MSCISSVVCSVSPSWGFGVVAQHWPGSLISVLALDLPLLAGYFPIKFHGCFKFSKTCIVQWFSTRDFCALIHGGNTVYLLSGSSEFLQQVLDMLEGSQRVIVTVEWTRHSASRPTSQRALKAGHAPLAVFYLFPLVLADAAYGGATDRQHLIGFGGDLGTTVAPTIEYGLKRMLVHVLDGGTEGQFPSVLNSSLPVLVNLSRAVLLHEGVALPRELLPSPSPELQIYAPSYKLRDCWVLRTLTLPERLRLHQLPLHMDSLLAGLSPRGLYPLKTLPHLRCIHLSFANCGVLLWVFLVQLAQWWTLGRCWRFAWGRILQNV
jgi:hypothetical protein